MNANDLRHRITIQKLTSSIDDNGFPLEVWADYKTVWSSKNNLSGREYWGAKAVQAENTVEFGIRYSKFVDNLDSRTYRIRHGNKTVDVLNGSGAVVGSEEIDKVYNITFIDNSEYRNTFVIIKSLELV